MSFTETHLSPLCESLSLTILISWVLQRFHFFYLSPLRLSLSLSLSLNHILFLALLQPLIFLQQKEKNKARETKIPGGLDLSPLAVVLHVPHLGDTTGSFKEWPSIRHTAMHTLCACTQTHTCTHRHTHMSCTHK